MSKDEFMRPPKFPWPSAIAMTKEEDGKLSLRVGNEKLNSTIKKDAFLPSYIHHWVDVLHGLKWFHTSDFQLAYPNK
ncbi:hypothetical protein TSMEX_007847 [Taenia solium]|eukprot:TsM_000230700 transcript=TsM_000230700 gene=TsM_000230700